MQTFANGKEHFYSFMKFHVIHLKNQNQIKVQSIWIDFKKLSLPLDKINPLKLNFLTGQNVSSRVKNKDITIFHFVYLFLILRSVQEYCILSRNGKNPLTRTSFFTIKCPETAKQYTVVPNDKCLWSIVLFYAKMTWAYSSEQNRCNDWFGMSSNVHAYKHIIRLEWNYLNKNHNMITVVKPRACTLTSQECFANPTA